MTTYTCPDCGARLEWSGIKKYFCPRCGAAYRPDDLDTLDAPMPDAPCDVCGGSGERDGATCDECFGAGVSLR